MNNLIIVKKFLNMGFSIKKDIFLKKKDNGLESLFSVSENIYSVF